MKKMFIGLVVLAVMSLSLASCKKKPKDEDLKAAIEKVVGSGVTVDVKEGVATLTGQVMDEAAKGAAVVAAKTVAGITAVTDNLSVMPPPPPPVVIAVDSTLIKGAMEAVGKFKGVYATVNDGVVSLTGEIKKADLPKLMQSIMALKPKSVDNKLTVK